MKDYHNTIDEQLAIITAYKNGETIQIHDANFMDEVNWLTILKLSPNYHFDFVNFTYRIKPMVMHSYVSNIMIQLDSGTNKQCTWNMDIFIKAVDIDHATILVNNYRN